MPTAAFASVDDETDLQVVAQSFTWKKLIQSGKGNNGLAVSTVLSDEFYLSDTTPFQPFAELQSTLNAFESNQLLNGVPAACRFPARYLWLSTKLAQHASGWVKPACPELDAWAYLDDLEGISIIQVSGYFGNPASAFGHLLLQVNRKSGDGLRGLQDLGVNFGARIPDGENSVSYILKGLFGAYDASFSDKSFYAQDYVYSATEFRDMWAYELQLTPFQQKMILFHLWELKDALFKYYFFKINCAFHLAQLLEIALELDFGLDHHGWFLPVTVFHTLNEIDAKQPGSMIKSVQFIPSAQREVHLSFEKLATQDKLFVNRYALASQALPLPKSASSSLLDFLLLYVDYKLLSEPKERRDSWRSRRTPILLARLRQPAVSGSSAEPYNDLKRFAPPAQGPKSRKLGVGVNVDQGEIAGTSLLFAPFAYDLLQNNKGSLVDSSFILGQVVLNFNDGDTLLDRFEIANIEKLAPPVTALAGEQKLNWRVALSVEHFPRRCARCVSPIFGGGVGKAKQLGTNAGLYGFVTCELNRLGVDAGLAAGALVQFWPGLRMRFESHAQLLSDLDGIAQSSLITHRLSALLNIGYSLDFSIDAEHADDNTSAEALLNYRF